MKRLTEVKTSSKFSQIIFLLLKTIHKYYFTIANFSYYYQHSVYLYRFIPFTTFRTINIKYYSSWIT